MPSDPNNPLRVPENTAIHQKIKEAAAKETLDVNEIIRLTNQLTEQEEGVVRFSVDAGLIDRLGRELVTRPEIAVAELIKNAYDADATQVSLSFKDTQEPGGRLIISDNGMGMTRDQFISGFMRLSSGDKVSEPVSLRLKRQRAGRKGIGRFAVQRLGEQLDIVSQTKDSPHALRVTVDWNMFTRGSDLSSIASRIREIEKQKDEGTTLTIYGLREAWTETAVKRVYRGVSDLIQPFTLRDKRPQQAASLPHVISQESSDFEISLSYENGESTIIVDDSSELFKYATATIEGFVDENGYGHWSFSSEQLGLDEKNLPIGPNRQNKKWPFSTLRNVDFKAYYFIYGKGSPLPRSINKHIQETAARRGGIMLYRNGYRVQPYGTPGNDWLDLDYAAQSRRFLIPVSNKNFFGFVEIFDPEGEQFEETSSREGLLDNLALRELTDFVYSAITTAVIRVGMARNRKVTASQRDWIPTYSSAAQLRATAADLRAISVNAREADDNKLPFDDTSTASLSDENEDNKQYDDFASENTSSALKLEEAAQNIEKAAKEQEEREEEREKEREKLLQELGMLRVLSSLGLIISEFTHEVKTTLGSARLDARYLSEVLTDDEEHKRASRLLSNIERFKSYASYFDSAVVEKNRRELVPQDLNKQIKDWYEIVKLSADRSGIEIHAPIFDSYELLTCPMHASELASVLFNFYTNADKAISRAERGRGEIQILVGCEDKRIYIEFSDNGDGVSPAIADEIFDPFFTTATPATARANDEDALLGTGLGLKIVRDIAQSYNGEVYLTEAPIGYKTCFRIEFPEATEEQKTEYGY